MNTPRPLPPLSAIRLSRLWPYARSKGHKVGDIQRIGYYSAQDGLDCVWLVDANGEYHWTADQDWIERHFEIVSLSDETDFFGAARPVIGPLV